MSAPDPITVELIGSALSSIVDEMGEALVRSSYSTNIKERRDCSTALFDRAGQVLCQAEHIPMHLGSFLGVITEIVSNSPTQSISPGDVFIANDPWVGAAHQQDVMLLCPVFWEGELFCWVTNCLHQYDIGGITPGSKCPSDSREAISDSRVRSCPARLMPSAMMMAPAIPRYG